LYSVPMIPNLLAWISTLSTPLRPMVDTPKSLSNKSWVMWIGVPFTEEERDPSSSTFKHVKNALTSLVFTDANLSYCSTVRKTTLYPPTVPELPEAAMEMNKESFWRIVGRNGTEALKKSWREQRNPLRSHREGSGIDRGTESVRGAPFYSWGQRATRKYLQGLYTVFCIAPVLTDCKPGDDLTHNNGIGLE
ncbi:hypothetical protein Taro_039239, partial [Colocasia esculenta]|nr:hypothetical protein [Colocasia esculenta]